MSFLSLEQAAKSLNLSQKALRTHIASKALAVERNSGVLQIPEGEIERFLREGHEGGALGGAEAADAAGAERPAESTGAQTRAESVAFEWADIAGAWDRPGRSELSFVDLFCGAGGLTKGLELAGLRGVCGLDHFDAAVATHRRNFDHEVVAGDIREEVTKARVLDAVAAALDGAPLDLVAGGFPCQGFSLSGYRVVHDSRNSLYLEMLELVRRLQPRFVVAENVPGIRSMLGGRVEAAVLEDFASLGYSMSVHVLLAADYHVPQARKRVFFVGDREGRGNLYPMPLLEPKDQRTTREAIEDLLDRPDDRAFNHVATKHSAAMAERLAAVPEGASLYPRYADAWKKCPWDAPSCTIKENHGGVNIHPRLPRVLTAREMARLQSFPDDFVFEGSKSKQLVQIGNAVPPLLGKAVGLAIRQMAERG